MELGAGLVEGGFSTEGSSAGAGSSAAAAPWERTTTPFARDRFVLACRRHQRRLCALLVVLAVGLGVLLWASGGSDDSPAASPGGGGGGGEQHIYIVRHGDKYSSYDDCLPAGSTAMPCFNGSLMSNNPPLTPCGRKQAEHAATWVHEHAAAVGGIRNIVVSPYTRTLQTALPLAKLLSPTAEDEASRMHQFADQAAGSRLHVEYLISEDRRDEGPHSPYNAAEDAATVGQLAELSARWDLGYGSPPIPTPETSTRFHTRARRASEVLRQRFPPSSGNLAVHSHATTSLSLAYGLCYGSDASDDATLKKFLSTMEPIGPAGVVHLVLGADGSCKSVDPAVNSAYESVECEPDSKTIPWMCHYADCPSWYWESDRGDPNCAC